MNQDTKYYLVDCSRGRKRQPNSAIYVSI